MTGRLARSISAAIGALAALAVGSAPASAATSTCYDHGYADLKARAITCDAANRVYKQSLNAARSGSIPTVFSRQGVRWSCRAFNPPQVAFYTWRCLARGDRMMQYRWKSGD